MIAIHAVLWIFRANTSVGEAGLYSYRYAVFLCWIVIPVLMASLAFTNPGLAYMSSGTYCYLPVRPFWFRLALSWIPRYLILTTIACMYLAIYLYVRKKFKDMEQFSDSDSPRSTGMRNLVASRLPEFPIIDSDAAQIRLSMQRPSQHRPLLDAQELSGSRPGGGMALPSVSADYVQHPSENRDIGCEGPVLQADESERGSRRPNRFSVTLRVATKRPRTLLVRNSVGASDLKISLNSSSEKRVSFRSPLNTNYHATASVKDALDLDLDDVNAIDGAVDEIASTSRPTKEIAYLRQRHKLIKRQLKYLFIYPLVYLLMWIVPFINHCLNYSDKYSQNPSYALSLLSIISITLQCAVDCWVFSSREKPWRFISGSRGTFWLSFAIWKHDRNGERSGLPFGHRRSAGKGRSEIKAETKAAQARRGYEIRDERSRLDEMQRERRQSLERRGGLERNWWEVRGDRRSEHVFTDQNLSSINGVVSSSRKANRQLAAQQDVRESQQDVLEQTVHDPDSDVKNVSPKG